MTRADLLAERFEAERGHLRAVAHRMLGSASDADDAVQEAWLRLSRSDAGAIDDLFDLVIVDGRILEIDLIADPDRLERLDVRT